MARRTRSFLFDNISKRLVQNTNKTAKEINTRVSANTTANTDILTKAEVQTVVSNTGINTLSDISIANVANEQVLQYNANTGKWENETLSLVSSVDGLTDTNLSSLSNGDYLVYSSAGSEWINRSLDLSGYVTDTEIADYSNTAQMNTAIAASNTLMTTYVDNQVANVDFSAYSTTTQMNTAIASSNTAMKNYVDAEVAGIVNSAPAALDTLNELAAALGDDANFSTTTSTALGNRLRIDVSNQSLTPTQLTNARTNLGLGTAATTASTDYATSAQGTKADTAHGWGNHASAGYGTSNFSGAYADLTGKPSLFSGSYNDLSNKPTIPTNNNQLTNGAGYITTAFINDEGSYTSDLDSLTASSDQGFYHWGSTQPTNSPGWNYGGLFVLRDNNQNLQLAIGNSGNGTQRLAIRRADSGSFTGNSWTEFWSTRNFSSTNVSNWNTAYGWGNHASAGYSTFSGSYNDLSNKPTIPTNNNQLTNGAGYITSSSLSGYVSRTLENSSRNLVIPTGSTSAAAGLVMETSSGAFMFQLYGTGTTYGFLDAQWGGWDIKKTAGGQMELRVSGTDYTVWHAGNLTNNNQLTNGAGYITSTGNTTGYSGWVKSKGNYVLSASTTGASIGDYLRLDFVRSNDGWPEYGTVISARGYTSGGGGALQLYAPYGSGYGGSRLRYRLADYNNSAAWTGWKTIWSDADFTSTNISNWNTAYGWGNHASAGYITNSGGTEAATASTVVKRNSSRDINARLFRSDYGNQSTISGAIAYRVNTSDNYIRFCSDGAAIRSFIGAGTSNFNGAYSSLSGLPTLGGGTPYLDLSTANYGTVKVDDDRGVSWAGYTIRDDWSLMSNGATYFGVYNDTDNNWAIRCTRGGTTDLRHNGTVRLSTDGSGVAISGRVAASGDSTFYQSTHGPYAGHTSSGNVTSLEIVNTNGTGDGNVAAMSFHCGNYYGMHMHLRHDSYFGIGGWSASTWRWYVQGTTGNMTAAGNVTAYSDPRLKENITPLTGAIDKIKKLNGMEFTWKDLPDVVGTPGARDYGVLSTEVAEVAPHAIHESPHTAPEGDTYKTVAYDKLIPLLIEAVKEQQKEIDELKAKLA